MADDIRKLMEMEAASEMTDKARATGTPPGNNPKAPQLYHNGKRIISALREWTEGLTTIDFVERFNVMRPGREYASYAISLIST